MKLTFICPTRNRPSFVKRLIFFASRFNNSDIKFIIVDNSSSSNFETRDVFLRQSVENIEYVRAPSELNMVDNWEWGLHQTKDDYVGFLTDKMFPLPHQFDKIHHFLDQVGPDLLSWFDDTYHPDSFDDTFGPGGYIKAPCSQLTSFEEFDANETLSQRLTAQTKRSEMSPSEYARGKICFGVYSQRLINKIVQDQNRLFFPNAPDYTSLVLGLGYANTAYSTNFAAVVHLNTEISNGNNVALHDQYALQFLQDSGMSYSDFDQLPIPGLYSSIHNIVLFDYLQMCKRINRPVRESMTNWYERIQDDITNSNRVWSSKSVMNAQLSILIEHELFDSLRAHENSQQIKSRKMRDVVFNFLPERLQGVVKKYRTHSFGVRYARLEDIIS